ncbi:MAG: methylthioribulose 1-phosphate dehydratase [Oscillatoriales cyanobacterium SM2_1_8]|nr:methylthioribulose 1-phosphate dehydratase [Oscillatoriales cyanobacterium SM2_1_8]
MALRQELTAAIAALYARGYALGTGGNFSAVADREPLRLWMAPSGVDKGTVTAEDLILVDEDGHSTMGKVSAEASLHRAIALATGAGAVLHTHSVLGTVLSMAHGSAGYIRLQGYEMLKGLAGITTHTAAVDLPIWPNSQDMEGLAARVTPHLATAPWGFLLAGHGLYAWGRNVFEARRHVEVLEFLLAVRYHAQGYPSPSAEVTATGREADG